MLTKLLDFICPNREHLTSLQAALDSLTTRYNAVKFKLAKAEDVISSNKTVFTDTTSKLHITSHAVHRYKSRFNDNSSDERIAKMLFKGLLRQLYMMDTLPDGEYSIRRGVVGIIKNNTLVTVIKQKDKGKPRLH